MMFYINPDYVRFFFLDDVGNIMLGCAVALQIIGYADHQADREHRGLSHAHTVQLRAVFVLCAAGLSYAGIKLYVKPKEAIERVAGTGMHAQDAAPVHPSLVFHDIVKRLGNLVPASPKDVTVMQRRLIRAGYRNPNALKILYGAKALFAVLLPVLTAVVLLNTSHAADQQVWIRTGVGGDGFLRAQRICADGRQAPPEAHSAAA